MIATKGARAELAMGEPRLYLLVGETHKAHSRWGPRWGKVDQDVTKIHVISPAAGGEIRGYWLVDGYIYIAHPVTPLEWPELDAEVVRVSGWALQEGRPL